MTTRKLLAPLALSLLIAGPVGCGFEPLDRVSEPSDDPPSGTGGAPSGGSVIIAGIEVSPAVIHAGDTVTLRDPVEPKPNAPAITYVWMACDGSIQPSGNGRQATWTAPSVEGGYSVTMNMPFASHGEVSRVMALCVAKPGEAKCVPTSAEAPVLESLTATPNAFLQSADCAGSCSTDVTAKVVASAGSELSYRWATHGGQIAGTGPNVHWELPAVGCCMETFSAALAVCDKNGTAATGFVNAMVMPE